MTNTEVREYEGIWEEIAAHASELRGQKVRVTVVNGLGSQQAVSNPPLERGSYARILQGLQEFPLEPDTSPDLWEVIAEERAACRAMTQEN